MQRYDGAPGRLTGVAWILVLAAGAPRPAAAQDPPSIQGTARARATASRTSSFPVDRHDTPSPDGIQLDTRIRVRSDADSGGSLDCLRLGGHLAVEALAGTLHGAPDFAGDDLPGSRLESWLLREAWLLIAVDRTVELRVGAQTSHWALGLVANAGDDTLSLRRPAWFSLPVAGDRVLRAMLYAHPFSPPSLLDGLVLAAGADRVLEDDVASLAAGEVATQGVIAARYHLAADRWLGLYYVFRDQEHDDGKSLQAQVLDAAADLRVGPGEAELRLQVEAAWVFGRTSLAPSAEHPEHDLSRGAALARASWAAGATGLRVEVDLGWLSGDSDPDDGVRTAFSADRSFQQGLLLFPRLLAWQTGRARINASDPRLSGVPAEDLDRLASDGAVHGATTFFPKVGWRVDDWLEVYGGVLLARASADVVDPFNTRVFGGGQARNYLAGRPRPYGLATELDAGVHVRLGLPGLAGEELGLHLAAEYGVLLPGPALQPEEGELSTIHGGRLTLALGE